MVLPTKIGGDPRRKAGLTHFENSSQAFERVHLLWPECTEAFGGHDSIRQHRWKDCSGWLNSLKKLRNNKRKREVGEGREAVAGSMVCREAVLLQEAEAWMKEKAAHLNSQQRLVLQKHVERAVQEVQEERTAQKSKTWPLMLLVHGGPGTGKSAVIFALKKFYVDVMKFEIGHEFLIGSLQASVAAMLGGETLHHIAGINPYRSQGSGQEVSEEVKQKEVSRRLAFARHLVIDEVFMLSAGFFAEAEAHMRAKVPQNSFFREAEDGAVRPWGGLNVTMFGDVRQIDPPEGIALYTVPQSLLTRPPPAPLMPLAAQGLELLWGQGVELIEFLEVYRCKDPWWQQARGQSMGLWACAGSCR